MRNLENKDGNEIRHVALSDHLMSVVMEGISLLHTEWTMITAFNTMPLFVGPHIHHTTHVDIHYHAIYCRSEWRAAGCLPLALGPAFTQVASTICIIATPARTTDKHLVEQSRTLDISYHVV